MNKRKKRFFKAAAAAGFAVGSASAVAANAFIDGFLSKKGIAKIAASVGLSPSEDSAPLRESAEAVAGINFYREKVYEEPFVFNKYGVCLHSIFYRAKAPSDVFVISCHDYASDPSRNYVYAKRFYDAGFNVLLPYLRGHGKSEHKLCSMGWLDRFDIIDWINYIAERNPNAKIILHGVSMGAFAVASATGEDLPENVVCCLEDCGYSSVWDQLSFGMREFIGPPSGVFLNIVNLAAKIRLGFDFKEASAIRQTQKSKTPTLFIHGDRDYRVPFWMNYPLYGNASCKKERLVVPGAAHAASACVEPELYWPTIMKFIQKYV